MGKCYSQRAAIKLSISLRDLHVTCTRAAASPYIPLWEWEKHVPFLSKRCLHYSVLGNLDNHTVRPGCSACCCFPESKRGICSGGRHEHTRRTHAHPCSYTQLARGAHKLPPVLTHSDSLDVAPLFSTQPEHPYVATLLRAERTELKANTNPRVFYAFGWILAWREPRLRRFCKNNSNLEISDFCCPFVGFNFHETNYT